MRKLLPSSGVCMTVVALVVLMLTGTLSMRADGLYDGLFDRPTYYPDFSPPTDSPSNMSYFVCARIGSERLHNYEVAVYDQNGRMRQCNRSITAQQELCTLTIPGDAGDKFHFQVIYGDFTNPTIVDVPETCEFVANDNVGTLANPFWLTVSDATGIAGIKNSNKVEDDTYYTLTGARVAKPTAPGIYIKKGKKIIIR